MARRLRSGSVLVVLVAAGCGARGFSLEWSWEEGEVLAMPAVGDLDGDGVAEVVAVVGRIGDPTAYATGAVVALDGRDGTVRWRDEDAHGRATVAIGDVDGDGRLDVVHAGRPDGDDASLLVAVDADGVRLWASRTAAGEPARIRVENGAPALVNLDDDPGLEIAVGGALFDNDGLLVWEAPNGGSLLGSPRAMGEQPQVLYPGSLATFVDLTGDGRPELLTGVHAWTIGWPAGDPSGVVVALLWADTSGRGGDGYPAVADLDLDGAPEVVVTAWPEIHVLDGATGLGWCGVDVTGAQCVADPSLRSAPLAIPGGNLGGPPTIADFDGDGRPEVAISAGPVLTLYDFNRRDEEVVVPAGDPMPGPGAMYRRWSLEIQDASSASNGVMGFDFDGDGAADLAHQDECRLRLLDGPTGAVVREIENTSITIHEYPVVADVDGDGASELVVVANLGDRVPLDLCAVEAGVVTYPQRQGVFVYGDDAWPSARPLWPSHTHDLLAERNSFRENFGLAEE